MKEFYESMNWLRSYDCDSTKVASLVITWNGIKERMLQSKNGINRMDIAWLFLIKLPMKSIGAMFHLDLLVNSSTCVVVVWRDVIWKQNQQWYVRGSIVTIYLSNNCILIPDISEQLSWKGVPGFLISNLSNLALKWVVSKGLRCDNVFSMTWCLIDEIQSFFTWIGAYLYSISWSEQKLIEFFSGYHLNRNVQWQMKSWSKGKVSSDAPILKS
jgi:hypothetical protein